MRVLILGVVLSPAAAMACAGLACSFVPAVTDGASMPANVPAVMFATASGPDTDFDPTDAGFELRRANGDEVASTIEANGSTVLIRPTQPLAANESFVVRYSRGCGRGEIEEARFSTSAAQPMPTSIGTLTVKAKGHGEIAVPQGSQCVEKIEGAYAQFAFTPSPEFVPFLAVTRWSLLVDGRPWSHEMPGAMRASGLLGPIPTYVGQFHVGPRVLEVYAACPSVTTFSSGVSLGTHTGELQATIAGVAEPLTTTFTFTLACTGPSDTPTPIEDTPNPTLPRPSGCASVPGLMCALAVLVLRARK